ncbi:MULTISPECIES: hypothetical protein [unclassified Streptomyces]|uniref:hypothetical protein n=1 Tax=unclassified Streptomyces TaxID=2593676 RepID=UPI002E10E721|nr:hypothetical protein OG725_20420 [Streptomyces sp. NBC_01213]WSQ86698.1 hypothetical protein OG722_21100 [Streptomyces sp. NBC_01212]
MMRKHIFVALGASAVLLSACSGGEQGYGYAVPSKVCDVRVDDGEIKPILPAGESIELRGQEAEGSDGRRTCVVTVDGKAALRVSISRDIAEEDVVQVRNDEWADFRRFSPGGDVTSAGVASNGGIAWMKCQPKTDQPKSDITGRPYTHLVLRVYIDSVAVGSENAERRADLEGFMRSYIPELANVRCR